jgi:hypothetical protein
LARAGADITLFCPFRPSRELGEALIDHLRPVDALTGRLDGPVVLPGQEDRVDLSMVETFPCALRQRKLP